MKEVDFYKKVRRDKVETIYCKSFLPAKKANFINSLFFPSAILHCTRVCGQGTKGRDKCNGFFYQCKKCGAVFGDVATALNCPMCKKKQKQKAPADNPITGEDKCD